MAEVSHATPEQISLSPSGTKGIYHTPFAPISKDLAQLMNSLLKDNHENHHVYFNDEGFHNHTVHHMLSLYALNTDPSHAQKAYNKDASYQTPLAKANLDIVADLQKDRRSILKYLPGDKEQIDIGNIYTGTQYPHLLEFWTKEIESKGTKGTLDEWVFKGDEVAEKIFGRLFAGFLHPFIHAGFALEFHQPAILAEALAQTCVHDNWIFPMLEQSEKKAASLKSQGTKPRKLTDLLDEIYDNEKLRSSAHLKDANKVRDGVLARAPDEMVDIASQWFVPDLSEDTINEAIAEHTHAAFLFTSTAAFHSTSKAGRTVNFQPRLDFFYIHDTNASIFFSAFAQDPVLRETIAPKDLVRLLEAKTRVDLAMYVSRGSPPIMSKLERIKSYETQVQDDRGKGWETVFRRVMSLPDDDSHAVKFIRALANAEQACKPYEDRDWCVIKGDMWLRIGFMAVDSWLGGAGFVRNTGWDEAWDSVPEWKL